MSLRSALLKEGTRHLAGVEEAVIKNLVSVRDVSAIIRSSLGPQGMNKMVINSHERLFITNDGSTILNELDVFHPAVKLVVANSNRQKDEVGDGTNFVFTFTGELLSLAELLLRMGLHVNDIISGYEHAHKDAVRFLNDLSTIRIDDFFDVEKVQKFIRPAIMTKQYSYENYFSRVVAEACVSICPSNPLQFDVDNVRIVKIPGGAVSDISFCKGMVFTHDAEGTIKAVDQAKVAVFAAGLDTSKPESKDVFLVTSPDQLENYQKNEEDHMEKFISEIHESGVNVVACHGKVGDLAMHFLERYRIMVVKLASKFDVTRLCKLLGAQPLFRIGAPTPEEIGYADSVRVESFTDSKYTVFEQKQKKNRICTIILRGATDIVLEDAERAVEKGVFAFKSATKFQEFVPGAGSTEIELSMKLRSLGDKLSGMDQYSYKKFAEALEVFPRVLAENAGLDSTQIISNLYSSHSNGNSSIGIDIEIGEVADVIPLGILDHLYTKERALTLATDAAVSILKIDQILMSKPASGPKAPKMGGSLDGGPDF